jgi:hypothetical protein
VVSANVDIRELERSLTRLASDFGEANQTGIARWGVAVARRLVKVTQAWGDGKDSRVKQQEAMLKDGYRAVFVVSDPKLVKRIKTKTLTGIHSGGKLWEFRPHQILTTAKGVNDWIDMNRTSRTARVPNLPNGIKCITSDRIFMAAMRVRFRRSGKAKGGWIGAGQKIAKFQKAGSRIAIGKNVAGYAHKFSDGGAASMQKSVWEPTGIITNKYKHASQEHVLKRRDMEQALVDGGKNTIAWYEKAMNSRLKKRK